MEKEREVYLKMINILINSFEHSEEEHKAHEDSIIDPESGVELGPRSRDELGRTKEAARIDRLEAIMEKYESKFGLEIQSLQDKFDIKYAVCIDTIHGQKLEIDIVKKDIETLAQFNAKKDIGTLATHLGNINTRLSNLEKKTFEILPEKKEESKKRGPYKKRIKALPKNVQNVIKVIADQVVQNDLGTKTITKYLTKINNVLYHSKNFSKAVIIAELRDKVSGPALAKLGGRETLKEVKKAKWRLDARRRRDAKIGIYGQKDYWKKRQSKQNKK